jgi:tetratricopeptide (TPR) repeat protein
MVQIETVSTNGAKPESPLSRQYKELLVTLKDNKQSYKSHLDVGRFLLRLKKYEKAISTLKVAKSLQPGKLTIYLLLGWALQKKEKYTEARLCYKQLLARNKDSIPANFQMANVLLKENKTLEAGPFLKRTIELHPSSRRSLSILAAIAQDNGDLNRALSYVDSLLEKSPNSPALLVQAGQIHYSAGRPSRAIEPLRAALAHDGDYGSAAQLLATILIEEGLPTEALKVISPVLSRDNRQHEFKLLEGKAYEGCKDKNRAITSYIAASRLKPDDYRPHLALGQLYLSHSDMELAERELLDALKQGQAQAEVYRSLSSLYLKSGQDKKAENILIEMSEIFISSPEPWRLLGAQRLSLGNSEGSATAFSMAIEKSPADAHLFCSRAKAHILNGAYDEAIEDFDRARELDPEVEAAKRESCLITNHKNFVKASKAYQQALTAKAEGNIDGCRKHYLQALELAPDNEKWMKSYGELCIYCGKFDDAIKTYEKLSIISEDNKPLAYFKLGNIHFGLNNFETAFKCYEQCATLNPLFIPARLSLIETLGHRLISGNLSPDRFPKILAAYRSELSNPSRQSIAHLELAWLYLHLGSHILPKEEWLDAAACNFNAAGSSSSSELIKFKYLGMLNLQRRADEQDGALDTLFKLSNLMPTYETYAVALLEQLMFLKYYSRGLRTSEQLMTRFPANGLIMAMNLEFFGLTAMTQKSGPGICNKRLTEIQRLLLKNQERGEDYLLLGLALIILKPSDQKFESGKKAITALNKALSLLKDNPWPLWALVRAELKQNSSQGNGTEELSDKILSICEQGLRQYPDFVPFIELIGRQQIRSKDPVDSDKGRIMLERAVLIDRETPGALFALANHYKSCDDKTTVRHLFERIQGCTRGPLFAANVQKQLTRLVS